MSDEYANHATGELIPLNLAELDEAELLAMFPTPVQTAGALLIARRIIAEAPAVLNKRSKAVKVAKRELLIARAYARERAPGRTAEDRKVEQEGASEVITAGEHLDEAELLLEYAREVRKSVTEDIDILRSLNANFRGEHQ